MKAEQELMLMLENPDPAVRRQAALHEDATEGVLLAALRAPDPLPYDESFASKDSPDPVVELEARFAQARASACESPLASERVLLEALEGGERLELAAMIACQHPNATQAVLQAGLRHHDLVVQTSAASSPNATEALLLEALAMGDDSYIRTSAIMNQNASLPVLLAGLDDRDFLVQLKAGEIIQNRVRMISGVVTDPQWTFYGKRGGELVWRRGEERISLPPDVFLAALDNQFFSISTATATATAIGSETEDDDLFFVEDLMNP